MIPHKINKNHPFLGVDAIAYIANLHTQHRLTDALDYIESCGLYGEAALVVFAVVGGVL
jgi:hypothetical protein